MGFFDLMLDGVKAVGNEMRATNERIMRYKDLYDRLDDEELIRKYKRTSGEQQLACAICLKERGYGSQN